MRKIIKLLKQYKVTITLALIGIIDILNNYSQDIILKLDLTEAEVLFFKIIMSLVLLWRYNVDVKKSNEDGKN